jgi:hypothetical protein
MPTGAVMLVKTKQRLTEENLRDLRSRFIDEMGLTNEDFYYQGALVRVTHKDYEIIDTGEEEFLWLNINFHRAFYDIGYERGDIKLYIRCAEWLEKEISDCEIYYGNDVNDESIVLFDKRRQKKLLESAR